MKMKKSILFYTLAFVMGLTLTACSKKNEPVQSAPESNQFNLYSLDGSEHQVQFQAMYQSSLTSLEQIDSEQLVDEIKQTANFLFGPLTYRNLAGIQKGVSIEPQLQKAFIKNQRVTVPYVYKAAWLIRKDAVTSDLTIPVPFSVDDLQTVNWKYCTDSAPDHSTWNFFWYFWDPSRPGCDHREGKQYQTVHVEIGAETIPTTTSFPEYKNLIHDKNGKPTLSMTFAFGYIEDQARPNPFKDRDGGMLEFQKFYNLTKQQLLTLGFTETTIYQKDITRGPLAIGSLFTGTKNNIQIEVSVVAAAGVDQMDIFTNSYAKKHDSFFGWFGHSRVGSGFDADQFQRNLNRNPDVFSVSPNYQLVYWAGCNSYSYYTLPFFKLKADLNPESDPHGTKKLDLISNALPSLFSFNAFNANVLFHALLNWQTPTTYQSIINKIETNAKNWGSPVMVNVLGDEDNDLN